MGETVLGGILKKDTATQNMKEKPKGTLSFITLTKIIVCEGEGRGEEGFFGGGGRLSARKCNKRLL